MCVERIALYGAHTTVSRYFARPEIKQQLRHTLGQL
jgi:hypothetical protein